MATIRAGNPIPLKKKGRKPQFDRQILSVAGKAGFYIHETNRGAKETIRRRARILGYSVETFASQYGGWDIIIS